MERTERKVNISLTKNQIKMLVSAMRTEIKEIDRHINEFIVPRYMLGVDDYEITELRSKVVDLHNTLTLLVDGTTWK